MSTRDWKLGEVVYLKSGSPAMTVISTDQHGATTVRWYDPQAIEAERTVYPTVVFPKDCLTEVVTPVRTGAADPNVWQAAKAMPLKISSSIQCSDVNTEELTQTILATLSYLFGQVARRVQTEAGQTQTPQTAQSNEKIVEATVRAAEPQRSEQSTAQTTAQRQSPSQDQPAQPQRQASPDGRQSEQPPRRKGS